MNSMVSLVDRLESGCTLSIAEYRHLIESFSAENAARLSDRADRARRRVYGNAIYIRGLIEISNYCKNDCFYCGIRKSNEKAQRYRLSAEEILACCREGYALGMRTFVLQGGEDPYFTDRRLIDLLHAMRESYPDCAITLSLGERSHVSYTALFQAGADRYLLRHETACSEHYGKLHPKPLTLATRLRCLEDLQRIGYQTGYGFMVGSPFQTSQTLAQDLKLIEQKKPAMCGIGPFIPQEDTPLRGYPAGSVELTAYLISIIRLSHPYVLLPATTALNSLHPKGRQMGLLAGANVLMPNLSPKGVRDKYRLYDNKRHTGLEDAGHLRELKDEMQALGYEIVIDRGDVKTEAEI